MKFNFVTYVLILCALVLLIWVISIQHNKIGTLESDLESSKAELIELRVQRELAHRRTIEYKGKLDSLIRLQKTTPEIVYIIKTKYNEKINSINALGDDEHIVFLTKWLPQEDSIRGRHLDSDSPIAN